MDVASRKELAASWFWGLQAEICQGLEALEREFDPHQKGHKGCFYAHTWSRSGGGGGQMALLEGALFEKAGVNVSTVFGEFDEGFRHKIPGATEDPRFWASGLSLVIHPRHPLVPIIHMNTRYIVTTTDWFGGGIDLTPSCPDASETSFFHGELKKVCDAFDPTYYPEFKAWADTYFMITHRKEPRGVGGIFYDNLMGEWDSLFSFTQNVGRLFLPLYTAIVHKRWRLPFGASEKQAQLKKRGRYVEFNLIYDRGTTFGLQTDGCIEAILMSLPPHAIWPSPTEVPEGGEDPASPPALLQAPALGAFRKFF